MTSAAKALGMLSHPLTTASPRCQIWRIVLGRTGVSGVAGQLAVPAPVGPLHVLEDDVDLVRRRLPDLHHGLGDGRHQLTFLVLGAAGVPLNHDVRHRSWPSFASGKPSRPRVGCASVAWMAMRTPAMVR